MALPYEMIVLPGDGIGPEVTAEAVRVLDWFREHRGLDVSVRHEHYGAAAYHAQGAVITDEVMADLVAVDAVLFGATGGPEFDEVPKEARRHGSLLRIRRHMEVFANLRPVIGYDELADTVSLKAEVISGVDMMIVRELNGGIYFGHPRGIAQSANGLERGINTLVYTTAEVERIARAGFELARKRSGRLCSIDKSNVLECTLMWREDVQRIGDSEFPDVELSHLLVDNAAMLTGSLGMLPSASLGAPDATGRRNALYEPVHGTAPDIAGQNKANPLAMMLSFAMMLRYSFDMEEDAKLVETAVENVLNAGLRTGDIMSPGKTLVSTSGMGEAITKELDSLAA